jgi:IclR family transcriptional regulator, KDG regulon repressor
VAILEYLASVDFPLGLAEISRELSLNKVSVFRILSSLEEVGWVIHEPFSQKYKLSENLLMFGLRLLSRIELQKIAGPHLYELAHLTGETTALSIRLGLERIFLQEIPGRYENVVIIPIGSSMPLWIGADGKSMLAFLPEDDIEKVIKHLDDPIPALTLLGCKVDVLTLKEKLAKIKEQGYDISAGEIHPDGCAVAAPIFGHNHTVIGSLRLRGLLPRFNPELATKYAPFVIKTANRISQELGFSFETN